MEELTEETKAKLRERQGELTRLLEAISNLSSSREWNVIKELVFDESAASIERQMLSECLAQKIDTDKLYKLQGKLEIAKRHSDTDRLADTLKNQLQDIKNKLK